ncbi:hypothetical protein [Pseudonocardia oroxyli]|uniref:Uncharacterized protein n=1 Tax=Pseudonocardia oroxyli TaxID=366584 RepID=A0A1G7YLD1_PSEOR|nr:hypothetical protein [Pseudonocardia oroxyli]SDG97187.1 hypothetical protein SAMN05216377_11788 [Pseudonocardia oroxyli]
MNYNMGDPRPDHGLRPGARRDRDAAGTQADSSTISTGEEAVAYLLAVPLLLPGASEDEQRDHMWLCGAALSRISEEVPLDVGTLWGIGQRLGIIHEQLCRIPGYIDSEPVMA